MNGCQTGLFSPGRAKPPAPPSRPFGPGGLQPERYVLPNGLKVLILPEHTTPVVAVQVWVATGSVDEGPDEAGIAHIHEHLLFKGTRKRGVGVISREVESAGGEINAWTSFEQTVYHVVLASRFVDTALDVLSDAVGAPSFDPAEMAKELQVIQEEIKQSQDSPSRVLAQLLYSTAYKKHPYRRPVIGSAEAVGKTTRPQVQRFFKRWYTPANMTLVVVGDLDPAKTKKRIERTFGALKGTKTAPERPSHDEPAQRATRVRVTSHDVQEAHLNIGVHVPGLRHADLPALDALAIILGQGRSSRLLMEVQRNQQLVRDVHAYASPQRERGLFVIGASVAEGKITAATRAIVAELYRLRHERVSAEELAKVKAIIESDSVYERETVQGLARKLGYFETMAGAYEFETEFRQAVIRLTPEDIRRTAERYFQPGNLTLAALYPRKALSDGATAADASGGAAAASERAPAANDPRLQKLATEITTALGEVSTEVTARHAGTPAGATGEVHREVLKNGLRVLVLRDPSVPLVALRAVYPGGLRYEDPRTSGINVVLASLLTKGTVTRSAEAIAREVEGMAGSVGGFSGRNSFGLRAEVMARDFDRGMELFADCLLHPVFPQTELDRERRELLERIRSRDDSLGAVAFRLFAETLYRKHPYRLDMMGSVESVGSLSPAEVASFYQRYYPPGMMTLAIVGDIDPARALAKVKQLFEHLPAAKVEAPPVPPEPARDAPETTFRHLPRQQAHMVMGFSGTLLNSPDRYPLEVLSTVLAGQGGRLFMELREKHNLAYGVSAFSLEGIDPGYFAVHLSTSPEKLEQAIGLVRAELTRIAQQSLPRPELDRAKRYLIGSHAIGLQRRSALAATLAFHEAYQLGWDEYRRYPEEIAKLTPEDIQRVAKKYLDLDRVVMAIVRPEVLTPGARKAVEAAERERARGEAAAAAAAAARPRGKGAAGKRRPGRKTARAR
jgi:zinc protease